MAHSFYAVKRGFDKKKNCEVHDLIFTDWLDVKPLVNKYDNARYKGFDTEEEAKVWLEVVDKKDAERRSKDTLEQLKNDIGIMSNEQNSEVETTIKAKLEEFKTKGYDKTEVFFEFCKCAMRLLDEVYGK
jgi:viroplasmin and RNaseH domain-containing protein